MQKYSCNLPGVVLPVLRNWIRPIRCSVLSVVISWKKKRNCLVRMACMLPIRFMKAGRRSIPPEYLSAVGNSIYKLFQDFDPSASWAMQAWSLREPIVKSCSQRTSSDTST